MLAPRKHRRLNLVRVQVHAGVEQRLAQALQPAACVLQGQVVRDVLGLVGREVHQKLLPLQKPQMLAINDVNLFFIVYFLTH
jgi:hypothetical protein